MFHQHTRRDILDHRLRAPVQYLYLGWYVLVLFYLWNFISLTSVLVVSKGGLDNFLGWILSAFYFFAGSAFGYFVYRQLYESARTLSTTKYTFFFCLTVTEVIFLAFLALGVGRAGAGGIILMTKVWSKSQVVGVFLLFSTAFWVIYCLFAVFIVFIYRRAFGAVKGGNIADHLKQESAQAVRQAAYDNREAIGQALRDNKDAIAKAAWDNRETIYEVAKDHRQEIAQAGSAVLQDTLAKQGLRGDQPPPSGGYARSSFGDGGNQGLSSDDDDDGAGGQSYGAPPPSHQHNRPGQIPVEFLQ
ncbi:hypothetical protein QOT17_000149 [Balamuthia mandrillaris]